MHKSTNLIRFIILLATVLVLPASAASAALVKCRTDPIFLFSNGDVLAVTVSAATDAANIRNIHYVLHVPAGVTVKQVTYTNRNFRFSETYEVHQDNLPNTYHTATILTTTTSSPVEVISMTRLNGVLALYVSGYSGDPLLASVSRVDSVGQADR